VRRIVAVGCLAAALALVASIVLRGDDGHRYSFVFENGSQLVPGNHVMIGGLPAGSVESISRTDENLAKVEVKLDQELHEGTTAVVRWTSLSGIANRYVSVEPGPNSEPKLEEGATLGLTATTTPVELDQLLNALNPRAQRGLSDFIQGSATVYGGKGERANETYRYFAPALDNTNRFLAELNADQRAFEQFIVSSSKLVTAVSARADELSSSISNSRTAFASVADESESLDRALQTLPLAFRQSNTTFSNLRDALDDVDPLVATAKPATRGLESFSRDLRPTVKRSVPVFEDLSLIVRRPRPANDAAELLRTMPKVRARADSAFARSEQAIADFQPTLDVWRAYSPDFMSAISKLGQITGYYDANGHYLRAEPTGLNIFSWDSGSGQLLPITPSDQYADYGTPAPVARCPGAATQPAPDNSNPFVGPTWPESGLDSSDCDPAATPPGP
jgi:phospholipid/cholesterol/gamma-HCH transport system substrate-binding protein